MKVVVHGPPACGKTRCAGTIARHFGLRRVVDGWDPADHKLEKAALHLTAVPCREIVGAKVVAFRDLPNAVRFDPMSARDAGCEILRPRNLSDPFSTQPEGDQNG